MQHQLLYPLDSTNQKNTCLYVNVCLWEHQYFYKRPLSTITCSEPSCLFYSSLLTLSIWISCEVIIQDQSIPPGKVERLPATRLCLHETNLLPPMATTWTLEILVQSRWPFTRLCIPSWRPKGKLQLWQRIKVRRF